MESSREETIHLARFPHHLVNHVSLSLGNQGLQTPFCTNSNHPKLPAHAVPRNLRSTSLGCIFDTLFRDTPLGYVFLPVPICPYAQIWPCPEVTFDPFGFPIARSAAQQAVFLHRLPKMGLFVAIMLCFGLKCIVCYLIVLYGMVCARVRKNDRSVTPKYGGVGFLVYYIYDDTW